MEIFFVKFEDICHFVFFTQHALKSRVLFENSFHLKQSMCLFDSIACMCSSWTCLFYKPPVLPLDVSILQQTVLPLDVSILQQTVLPLDVSFYSRLSVIPVDVSILQQTVLPLGVSILQ